MPVDGGRGENSTRDEQVAANTDRELWREGGGDGNGMSYYEPSIHVTEQGRIGINVGGTVYVKTLREWHALAGGPYTRVPDASPAAVPDVAALAQSLLDDVEAMEAWRDDQDVAVPLGELRALVAERAALLALVGRLQRQASCDCVPCIISSRACHKCGRRAVMTQEWLIDVANRVDVAERDRDAAETRERRLVEAVDEMRAFIVNERFSGGWGPQDYDRWLHAADDSRAALAATQPEKP